MPKNGSRYRQIRVLHIRCMGLHECVERYFSTREMYEMSLLVKVGMNHGRNRRLGRYPLWGPQDQSK